MNKIIYNLVNVLDLTVLVFKVMSLIVFIGSAGALENDAITFSTFIIRTLICVLVMLFL